MGAFSQPSQLSPYYELYMVIGTSPNSFSKDYCIYVFAVYVKDYTKLLMYCTVFS